MSAIYADKVKRMRQVMADIFVWVVGLIPTSREISPMSVKGACRS